MDFFRIKERPGRKKGVVEIYPDFVVKRSRDLMVRANSFYAIWDEEKGLWSTDEYDVQRLVDKELNDYVAKRPKDEDEVVIVKYMSDFSTNAWSEFRRYMKNISDNAKELDKSVTFQNTPVTKTSYVSRRLPYSLEEGPCEAYNSLMSVLYAPDQRRKLEWAIGAIISGDAKDIQKFIVLHGAGGTGKSTFLNILQKLFAGYYSTFEAKALTGNRNDFSTEAFRDNPLVAIQHDGDLSNIQDNTKLNSIVSHEEMRMNEKYKPTYSSRVNCFLFMASNKDVKITDAKSGIIRRLIDVYPTGNTVPTTEYFSLISRIEFELGQIANHCLNVYRSMGKNYYSTYIPEDMIVRTNVFFNFVLDNYYTFLEQDGVSLAQAYSMYKAFCEDSSIEYRMAKYKFRDELKNYFEEFLDRARINGKEVRSYYQGFLSEKFKDHSDEQEDVNIPPGWLFLDQETSIFDDLARGYPAQLATSTGIPSSKWSKTETVLADIDTRELHFVKLPTNHIVIDFDIRDKDGTKSPELNVRAAANFPPTYAEFSMSRAGIHLHYIWDGDATELSRLYDEGIEVKVFTGDASLRRKLSTCNNFPIAHLSTGLPIKKKKMIDFDVVQSEKGLRELIKKNLRKEIHPATKPSIDFIHKILEEAYSSGIPYDVRDLRPKVLAFALRSTNQAQYCVKLVGKMRFNSEDPSEFVGNYDDDRLVFFDVEVFPNLFLVNWKFEGEQNECVHMINPTPQDIEGLLKLKLVGFNNRRYDNHILYARYLGYDNAELFAVSNKIIDGHKSALFREAYSLSYADVYDFSSKKQSLKKFQIELGIHHKELGLPFDQPIPEHLWPRAIEYCDNDVVSTEKTFNARREDFVARQILSDLSGLSVNDTTRSHTEQIIFGDVRNPQVDFEYTNLAEMFPGYRFDAGKSTYRGEEPGEGGYVYAEPGYYENVSLLDVASMHPTSTLELNLFGPYTKKYAEIIEARLAIKHKDFDKARTLLGGALEKYLVSVDDADALSYALKIIINIVYGLSSASFANRFLDPRNKDNIVAKRGALFMIDLKHAVQEQGFIVAHIKTDSIKIPNATEDIIRFVFEFGKRYGYTFEHEATYEKFCLVNDAVYVARDAKGHWTTVGAQFSHPYVYKTLFSHEPIEFEDMMETKSVTTALYLNMDELYDGTTLDPDEYLEFVGKTGSFVPIRRGAGGGELLRQKDDKFHAVTGTKGWRWLESEVVRTLGKEADIDLDYFRVLVDKAIEHISEFVDFDTFVS